VAVAPPGECWLWQGALDKKGYGVYGKPRRFAHRIVYEEIVGPIPAGLTIDHLCRVKCCVNPAHMEPVTIGENVLRGESVPAQNARKSHCHRGHPLSGDNLYVCPTEPSRHRRCRECRRMRERAKAAA
jgi:hypothetical protein